MRVEIRQAEDKNIVKVHNMRCGQAGVITNIRECSSQYIGKHVMKTCWGLAFLEDGKHPPFGNGFSNCVDTSIDVALYPKGTQIILTVE